MHPVRQSEQCYRSWMETAENILSITQVVVWRVLRRIIRQMREKPRRLSSYWRSAAITFCAKFKLFTDHEALKYIINMKEQHGRIFRWMSTFAEYDFDIAYRRESKNANADYLSRPKEVGGIVLHVSLGSGLDVVKQYLMTGTIEARTPSIRKATKIRSQNYVIYSRNLFRRTATGLRYIPDEWKNSKYWLDYMTRSAIGISRLNTKLFPNCSSGWNGSWRGTFRE